MNNKLALKASTTLIALGVLALFVIGVLGANVFFKVQKIENGEASLETDSEKLKNTKLDLPQTELIIATGDDPSAGSPEANVHIVEFSDFQCPYCKLSFPIVLRIIQDYGDKIHFIYRDFPLPSHPYAQKAAEAAECAHDQGKFWPMHNKIFENQSRITVADLKQYAQEINLDTLRFSKCLDSNQKQWEVKEDYQDGEKAGVRGTPTFFINNKMIFGSVSLEEMKAVIDMELELVK